MSVERQPQYNLSTHILRTVLEHIIVAPGVAVRNYTEFIARIPAEAALHHSTKIEILHDSSMVRVL